MSAPHGYFHTVGKIYEFLVHLAVVLGGMISLFWLAGSLFLYGQLGRPAWEWAILVAVSLFGFCWFCVREFKRRKLRAAAGKPADEDNWGEGREELEIHLAEIEEELSEARQKGTKGMIEKLEEGREDVLSQLEGLELEVERDAVEGEARQRERAPDGLREEEGEAHPQLALRRGRADAVGAAVGLADLLKLELARLSAQLFPCPEEI